jgi:uncharacterized protein YbbK (DUF523 family)
MYIISMCLLGIDCKYNGGNNLCTGVRRFAEDHSAVVVCPETAGGLKAPREPAERIFAEDRDGETCFRVVDRSGKDLTEEFILGAERSLKKVLDAAAERGEEIEGAILKANSPSCGYGRIYDGTFSGTLVSGDGVFAEMLRRRGIPVKDENSWEDFLEK